MVLWPCCCRSGGATRRRGTHERLFPTWGLTSCRNGMPRSHMCDVARGLWAAVLPDGRVIAPVRRPKWWLVGHVARSLRLLGLAAAFQDQCRWLRLSSGWLPFRVVLVGTLAERCGVIVWHDDTYAVDPWLRVVMDSRGRCPTTRVRKWCFFLDVKRASVIDTASFQKDGAPAMLDLQRCNQLGEVRLRHSMPLCQQKARRLVNPYRVTAYIVMAYILYGL